MHQGPLTRREQEIPHLYRWWDELRLTRRVKGTIHPLTGGFNHEYNNRLRTIHPRIGGIHGIIGIEQKARFHMPYARPFHCAMRGKIVQHR